MKNFICTTVIILMTFVLRCQCSMYQIYESFTSTLPTQGGTWTANSMIAVTTPVRTGTHAIGFNGTGDWIRTPQIANPGVLTFWYRRSSNTTAWTLNIQTSPDGTTWTTRGSITTVTTTYAQYTLNIGTLGLTNVFIRLIDARASGAHERYVEDLGLTSTSTNTLIPIVGACSQTLSSTLTYDLVDDGGPAGTASTGYSNNVDRTITLTPSDNTLKLNLQFTVLDLETSYDYLYIYDGANTSAPLLATLNGTTLPSDITATNANGQLTVRWTTDVSNVGAWGGFTAKVTSISVAPLPVELVLFEGTGYPQWNVIKWTTASEHNSDYFELKSSADGVSWRLTDIQDAAGNSTQLIKYDFIDYTQSEVVYYKLIQFDVDGEYKEYGPITVHKNSIGKTVIKYVNLLGQEVNPTFAVGVVLEVYSDGSMRRVIR